MLNGPLKLNKTGKNDSPNENNWAVSKKEFDGKNEVNRPKVSKCILYKLFFKLELSTLLFICLEISQIIGFSVEQSRIYD